ncbi:MAG TPA: crosslink repair DNA glycosylase YcaQ family protein [Dokdonella sp.]|uniref:winged helix-turn-helix domain-containing protein n=1 Tax=Dokdonella sp. TaxID=2291710 RepID=UPI002D801291|nr:crosslink repair DNA glycosylase YcaQ family protein [Dokdonella sp.]HET9033916.1 crosslink repair DNA glycosylase YcaQ family protein [Dokdonella sp.]
MIENPSPALKLGTQQARNLHLAAQGILRKPPARPRRADLLAAIERMQLLQIDTIHVVARSPYLVLFSRLGNYPVEWLDKALEHGEIFECWSHEACFVPSSRFAVHRGQHASGARDHHWACKNAARLHDTQRADMDAVLRRIREQGPAKASEFESTKRAKTGWWDWKDEKRWLEALFTRGELMVARRERFQRVYDLSERVVARMEFDPHTAKLSDDEIERALILDSIKALGIAQARWVADYYRTRRKHKDADLAGLVASGDLIEVEVQGWANPGYVHRDHVGNLNLALAGKLRATHTTLLSPFDPLVWDRARASIMFGFDYTIECYVPEAKRRYGYFVLPILHRGKLIGRLDAKAHRADGRFEVKSIHLEGDVEVDAKLIETLATAIHACANWHQTPTVVFRRSEPRSLAVELRKAL